MADKIICVSKRQAEIISDQASELKDKIIVAYNPLPSQLLNIEPRKELDEVPSFLYVGGDSYVKGFHMLLQTLRELGRRGVKARFILTNTYRQKSLEKLKRLNEKYENLEILVAGRLKYEEVIELHKKTWALIFPSIWEEPLPYAVVESSLHGTLPIASKAGGVKELIVGSQAERFLFSPGKFNELVDKILMIISSKDVNEVLKMGRSIRNHVLQLLVSKESEYRLIRGFVE